MSTLLLLPVALAVAGEPAQTHSVQVTSNRANQTLYEIPAGRVLPIHRQELCTLPCTVDLGEGVHDLMFAGSGTPVRQRIDISEPMELRTRSGSVPLVLTGMAGVLVGGTLVASDVGSRMSCPPEGCGSVLDSPALLGGALIAVPSALLWLGNVGSLKVARTGAR